MIYDFFFKKNEGGKEMPTNVINVHDLDEDDVKILERFAEYLRATKKMKGSTKKNKRNKKMKWAV